MLENALHTYDDIEDTRKVLQSKGLIVAIKNSDGVMCDMIPDDIAQCIRKYYNIEIRTYGYEKIVDYVLEKANVADKEVSVEELYDFSDAGAKKTA